MKFKLHQHGVMTLISCAIGVAAAVAPVTSSAKEDNHGSHSPNGTLVNA
ncbi:MAG: hypothetical protein AB8B97_10175 [Granulosicoccus sp.]